MDVVEQKRKKNLIVKTWERCLSLGSGIKRSSNCNSLAKNKSWSCTRNSSPEKNKRHKTRQVAPEGCFSVYVGSQKQRFVIKTEFANHPLFKMLLEDAEVEYGYDNQGPILLPCDVDLFYKVLAEMESGDEIHPGCSFAKGYSPFILCSPAPRPNFSNDKGYGAYRLLTPSRMLKFNGF